MGTEVLRPRDFLVDPDRRLMTAEERGILGLLEGFATFTRLCAPRYADTSAAIDVPEMFRAARTMIERYVPGSRVRHRRGRVPRPSGHRRDARRVMIDQRNRHSDSLVIVVGLVVALILVIVTTLVFHLGGEPGLPPCPKHDPHPTTVECH